ncbi:hypothetical protein AMECASPLE_035921 [Ameca splendens]|uniref:Uncharacterized protein n=1 Tax=Ameca splendens TaxID=208324 RepID=A0ABV0Y809_9TELE
MLHRPSLLCLAPFLGLIPRLFLWFLPQRKTSRNSKLVERIREPFDSDALEALKRTAQTFRTGQQLEGFHRPTHQSVDTVADGSSLWGLFRPSAPFLGSTSTAPGPRLGLARAQGDHGGAQTSCPFRAAQNGRCIPRPSGDGWHTGDALGSECLLEGHVLSHVSMGDWFS